MQKRFNIQRILVYVAASFAILKPFQGFPQSFKATLDTTAFRIGEQVSLKLDVTVPSGSQVKWPAINDTLAEGIEVIHRSKIDSSATSHPGYIQFRQQIRITSFDTGYHTLPPFVFSYHLPGVDSKSGITDTLLVRVLPVEVDTTAAIRDIKGQMSAPITFSEIAPYLGIGLAIAVIAAITWYYFWRKKLNKPFLPILRKPQLPAWQIALNNLDKVEKEKLWQTGKIKEYYSAISDTVRTYIENQFGIDAMEMVTADIIEAWVKSGHIGDTELFLRQVLQLSDLVKFAKERPMPEENELTLTNARKFVLETKPSEVTNNQPATGMDNGQNLNEQ